jgi:hypothetical protein
VDQVRGAVKVCSLPSEFPTENSHRLVNKRLRYRYLDIAVQCHLQNNRCLPAKLKSRDMDVRIERYTSHLALMRFLTSFLYSATHNFVSLRITHVAPPLLRFSLGFIPESPGQMLPHRLCGNIIGSPILRARQFFERREQFVWKRDVARRHFLHLYLQTIVLSCVTLRDVFAS